MCASWIIQTFKHTACYQWLQDAHGEMDMWQSSWVGKALVVHISVMLSPNQNTLIQLNINIQFSSFFFFLNFVCPPRCLVPCASYAFKFVGLPKCLWSSWHVTCATRFQGSGIFGPIDIANLWNLFNRIRIIIGKFACTQIRISSSCSSQKKTHFLNLFSGIRIFCPEQRFNLPFDKNGNKKCFDPFLTPWKTFLAKKWGYRGCQGEFSAQMFP